MLGEDEETRSQFCSHYSFPKHDRPLACMNHPPLNKCGKENPPRERSWFYPGEQLQLRTHHSVPLEPMPVAVNTRTKKLP